jgi:ABC-2 type transport system permease protein
MEKLLASIIKETKVIFRDRDSLLVLFLMPLAFVLIMSLALENVFKEKGGGAVFTGVILDLDGDAVGTAVVRGVSGIRNMDVKKADGTDEAGIKKAVADGWYSFGIIVPAGATRTAERGLLVTAAKTGNAVTVRLLVDPAMRADHRSLIASAVNQALLGVELNLIGNRIGKLAAAMSGGGMAASQTDTASLRIFAELKPENVSGKEVALPSSVQQSVPGYSLIAMFFIVVPLSVAFIKERQEGSLVRILSMPVPGRTILLGKAIPFFLINQAQLILMLFVGMYIVPLLGGDALDLGNSPAALAVLAASASLAAVSYGIMISTFCKSVEQAATLGGTSAIIFGALGGVMVPKFEMPLYMQKLTVLSPMSWGLEGFLDVFVRNGGIREILPRVLALVVFSLLCASVAVVRFRSISSRS